MKFSKELMKGSTQQLILAVLEHGDWYGYEIIKEITRRSETVLELGEGSVYPMLHLLERKGLIEGYWLKKNGRERKYYRTTKQGKAVFQSQIQEWLLFSQSLNKVFQLSS